MLLELPDASLAKNPAFFRWQYLHIVGESRTANAVLHETDIFGFGESPYVSVCHDLAGAPAHARRSAPGLTYEGWGVNHAVGRVRSAEKDVVVDAGRLGLRGQLRTRAGVASGELTTTLLERDGKKSHWRVLSVGCEFDGFAEANSQASPLRGAFYMDRQWGDLPLQSVVKRWAWGHLVSRSVELVYFDIVTTSGDRSKRVLLRDGGSWQQGNLIASYLPSLRVDSLAMLRLAPRLQVAGSRRTIAVQFEISPSSLLRSRQHEEHDGFRANYARWRASGRVTAPGSGTQSMVGVTELLEILR